MKLALLILTREEKDIVILNGDKKWIPSIEHSDTFGTSILCINEDYCFGNKNLEFQIDNIEESDLDEINDMVLIFNKYDYVDTKYGQILLDTDQKGKMYVNGLYVMFDNDFDYGYNFKAEHVKLDRDRKYISWYDLREIAAKSIISADVSVLMNVVGTKGTDTDRIESHIDEISGDFKAEYKKQYYEKYNLKDDVILITESQAKKDKIIENEKFHITEALNIKIMSNKNYINELNEFNKKEQAYDYYNSSEYKDLLDWLESVKNRLTNEQKQSFIDTIESFEPSYFSKIKNEVIENLDIF